MAELSLADLDRQPDIFFVSLQPPRIDRATSALPSSNYRYTLINLPLYLAEQLPRLQWER